jgi:hypothetical protein
MFWEGIAAGFDLFIGSFDFRGLEGRFSDQLRVAA